MGLDNWDNPSSLVKCTTVNKRWHFSLKWLKFSRGLHNVLVPRQKICCFGCILSGILRVYLSIKVVGYQ